MEKIPMTAAGYTALETELKHCQQVERPRIIQQITEARTHGDLSENAEYHAAKEQQSHNEGRIVERQERRQGQPRQILAHRELLIARGLRELVPRTTQLAVVASENAIAHQGP
jgi:hypothetical protein